MTGLSAVRSHSLAPLFQPNHIAVVGASATPGKRGRIVIDNLLRGGFRGRIYPVNPIAEEIVGLQCFPSVAAIPERVDCAMMVIPASAVVDAFRDCARAGARSVVIGASGFAELGTAEGLKRQAVVTELARESGTRLLGPNTNGLLSAFDKVSLGYNSEHGEPVKSGPVSIVSHSGALFGGIVRSLYRCGVGVSKFVPVGNEADIDMLEVLEYLIEDPTTSVVGLVIEGLADGERFQNLALRAREAGKAIVALKLGRSKVGMEATLAHSSRLAGSARAYEALFQHCGAASVRTVEALAGGCALLAARTAKCGSHDRRLVCVTSSGAGGSMLADYASERGIVLAGDDAGEWSGSAAATIAEIPTTGRMRNPIDVGSLRGDWSRVNTIFAALEKDGITGPTAVYAHIAPTALMNEDLARAVVDRKTRTGAPAIVVAPGGLREQTEEHFVQNGVPVFNDIVTAFESLVCHYATLPAEDGSLTSLTAARGLLPEASKLLKQAASRERASQVLSEIESAAILRAAGVPVVRSDVVGTAAAATKAAEELGYPVVLKALASDVAHKNAAGFVVVDIGNASALAEAYAALEARVASRGFQRNNVPFIVQPMLRASAELIVGVTREPGLGHFLVLGLGGVYTEVLNEVMLWPISASPQSIRTKMDQSKIGALISRIGKSGDLPDQVLKTILSLQKLIANSDDLIESIDINPLLIHSDGCVAVDALVILAQGRVAGPPSVAP